MNRPLGFRTRCQKGLLLGLLFVAAAADADDSVAIPNPEVLAESASDRFGSLLVGAEGAIHPDAVRLELEVGRVRCIEAYYARSTPTNAVVTAITERLGVSPVRKGVYPIVWRNEKMQTSATFMPGVIPGVDSAYTNMTVVLYYFGKLETSTREHGPPTNVQE